MYDDNNRCLRRGNWYTVLLVKEPAETSLSPTSELPQVTVNYSPLGKPDELMQHYKVIRNLHLFKEFTQLMGECIGLNEQHPKDTNFTQIEANALEVSFMAEGCIKYFQGFPHSKLKWSSPSRPVALKRLNH